MKVLLTGISHVLNKKKCSIFSIDSRPNDSTCLVTGGQDGAVKVWRITEQESQEKASFIKHAGAILCVRFSLDGKTVATASDDGTVIIWGVVEKENTIQLYTKKRLNAHKSDVSCLSWCKKYLASGGYDGSVIIYDTCAYNIVCRLEKHEKGCKGIEFSPEGEYIATYGDEGEVFLYDSAWKKIGAAKKPFKGVQMESFFGRMSWSPDGKYIACGLSFYEKQDAVSLLSPSLVRAYTLIGHTAPVETVTFNPWLWKNNEDVSYIIATGSQDRSIAIWSSLNAKPLILLTEVCDQPIMDLRWTSDGRTLYGCSYDGTVFILEFNTELGSPVAPVVERVKNVPYSKEFVINVEDFPAPEQPQTQSECAEDSKTPTNDAPVEVPVKKKIVPRLIKPLEMPDELGVVKGQRVVLFTERKVPDPTGMELSLTRLETVTKTDKYAIDAKLDRSILVIKKNNREWFTIEGHLIKGMAAHSSIIALVCEDKLNKDINTVWVYSLERGVLLMPAMPFYQVVTVDVKYNQVLIVTLNAFKVINLIKNTAVDGTILAHAAVMNILLDEKYFLVVLYEDGSIYYYNPEIKVWCALEMNCPSAYSDIYTEEDFTEKDATFDSLENTCVIGLLKNDAVLVSNTIKKIIEIADRATPCTTGLINRVDSIIEQILLPCSAEADLGIKPADIVELLLKCTGTKEFQEYAYRKVKELQEKGTFAPVINNN
ncbi:protein HIRA/HIR1 [Nematocida sp. ERTm5]|nr:protein HIRA/HIR1 [Nematocida sp. ERTm5]